MSQFKFDSEGQLIALGNFFQFINFCLFNRIHCKDVQSMLFTLTLEGRVKRRCHILKQLIKELHGSFDRYDYQDVCKRIDFLIMKLDESIEDFLHLFIHLCYEFSKGVIDSNFIMEKFQSLILLTLRSFES